MVDSMHQFIAAAELTNAANDKAGRPAGQNGSDEPVRAVRQLLRRGRASFRQVATDVSDAQLSWTAPFLRKHLPQRQLE